MLGLGPVNSDMAPVINLYEISDPVGDRGSLSSDVHPCFHGVRYYFADGA